ncbi:MAG: hypothetical protein PVG66_09800 [Chromatiales bacterium]|jgi:hypothetical protein
MNDFVKSAALILVTSAVMVAVAKADVKLQASQVHPTLQLQSVSPTKPATCAPGFIPVDKKLVEHEGKKWYEYNCVHQEVINRTCNMDTQVTNVKNDFVSLPSDGKSKKSKLMMSYKCFNYVPVK